MYRELDPRRIVATAEALAKRVEERFAGSGLARVCAELHEVAVETQPRIEQLRRPRWGLRALAFAAVVGMVALAAAAIVSVRFKIETPGWAELIQGLDAVVNEIILLGVALFFLFSLETRAKRRTALRALHELRSLAHVIDMHQLTKDPEHVLFPHRATASSPSRSMDRFELGRYLDYCSEGLSIVSKLAALHVQYFNDEVVLDASDDVQDLAQALSGKIGQKILLLDAVVMRREGERR
jgi:hypothetical protein